jgi:hypothetical protein
LYVVYAAMREDNSCPACDLFAGLKSGSLPGYGQDADASLQPDERLREYQWFFDAIKYFAEEGEPRYRHAVNYLQAGIWEFKYGILRLTFYDTPGDGRCTQKGEIVDYADADEPDSDYWHIPTFDRELRLGHWFIKDGQKTRESDLIEAEKVREEDLEHDRRS